MKTEYVLNFSDQIDQAISELVKKHNLTLSQEDFWDFEKENPEVVIFKVAKKIVAMEKGVTMKDIIEILKKDLYIAQEKADKLAHDIKNNVVSLAQPEEEIEVKKEVDQKERYRQELLNKIRGNSNIPVPKEMPPDSYIKKVDILDVEENAENIQHAQQRVTKEEPKPQPKLESKPDTYREPIE
ncbi:MAG: hypothetical protein UR31_C0013G0023 [Parcubacteria group bacterium GW2011_GWA2_33_14]|uniref:Uncharacterized protein n=1 Tax=Candidatus Staskawiczbacteria bacterium RIFCSPHIGHO2_02_FULL_33_16 TaxID=1802204 RepID=A0A1G2HW34_9BACT|nr:MAG: hypothetical protein UR31_C0013G0023 [Parcubacteria group bacterium GW2011_GWA2_33_14]OGZ66764.1 MAG: hypothetical protein A3D34_03575 [Candidatus Staskawiczbacteria bacterium RIFCSPHIGHO2_02_FULL_33_16]OGZ70873.1 MAG: hypothetical protein A2980_02490 [Candidatus Staskawiczbacteria bacterium RIFCSPLOWO2_01_FULL_33_13]